MWGELFGFVYAYLRRCGLSHADAEDIAQETLEAAVVNLDAVEPGRLHAWLLVVARRKLLSQVRRGWRTASVAEMPDVPDSAPDPGLQVVVASEREELDRALAQLSPRDRELIRTRYLDERTVAETSKRLGLSISAAKVALMRARNRLAHVLETRGGHGD